MKLFLVFCALCGLLFFSTGCASFGSRVQCFFSPSRSWENGIVVRQDLLERNEHNLKYKYAYPMPVVEYITIHNTWNFAPAWRERDYLNSRRDPAYISYHFAVDEEEAVQILPLDISGWHAGDTGKGPGNRRSIGIEICRSRCVGAEAPLYYQSEDNAARLSALLLKKFTLPPEALRKHQDWSKKYCPHRILDEKRWDSFVRKVTEYRNALEEAD